MISPSSQCDVRATKPLTTKAFQTDASPTIRAPQFREVFFSSRPLPPVLSFLPSQPAGNLRIQNMLTGDETAPPTSFILPGGRQQRWPACPLSLPPSGSLAPETGDFREISGDPRPLPGSSPLLPFPLQTAQAWFPEGGGVQREVTFWRPVDLQGGAGEGGDGFGEALPFPQWPYGPSSNTGGPSRGRQRDIWGTSVC